MNPEDGWDDWTRGNPGAVVLLALAPPLAVGLAVWFVLRALGAT